MNKITTSEPAENVSTEFDSLLTPSQVSQITGIPVSSLGYQRWAGTGIRFVKLGRSIRYRRSDLEDYISSHVFASTEEAANAR